MTATLRMCGLFTALILIALICMHTMNDTRVATGDALRSSPVPTPWACIGGCGASSGSVSMDTQLKWIGRGVTGALFDAEVLYMNAGVSDNSYESREVSDGHLRYRSNALLLNLFYHMRYLDFKLGLPLVMKSGHDNKTGLMGDMSLDITKKWGMLGNIRSALTFSLPTGRYDIYTSQTIRNPEMQLGSGTVNAGIRLDYTMDKDWGIITLGTAYSGGFFGMRTKTWEYDTTIGMPVPAKKTLAAARYFTHNDKGTMNGWGSINDVGTVQPDMASWFADVGIKVESMMHGFCLSYSLPTCGSLYEERSSTVTNWYNNDPASANYVPTIELAQMMADTSIEFAGKNPVVMTTDQVGRWVVMERSSTVHSAFPGLTLQYSLEKSDSYIPLLFGAAVRMDYNKGFHFAAFGAGIGIKFRIY